MCRFEHIAVPADQHEAELEHLDHGPRREAFAMCGADTVAFGESLVLIRHRHVDASATLFGALHESVAATDDVSPRNGAHELVVSEIPGLSPLAMGGSRAALADVT